MSFKYRALSKRDVKLNCDNYLLILTGRYSEKILTLRVSTLAFLLLSLLNATIPIIMEMAKMSSSMQDKACFSH